MAESTNAEDARSIEDQIADLRAQIEDLTEALADQRDELLETMREKAEDLAEDARGAIGHVQHEASAIAHTIRENPIGSGTLLAGVAGIALAVGYLLGTQPPQRRDWW